MAVARRRRAAGINLEVATRGERLDVVVYDLARGAEPGIVWHTRVG